MQALQELERKGDYLALIQEVKQQVAANPRVFTDPFIKHWCGRRWRNFFINEALKDAVAVQASEKTGLIRRKDPRPAKQKIAERFLRGEGLNEWNLEMPEAQVGKITKTTLVFSPGLLTGMLPVQAFQEAFPAIEQKYGWRIIRSDSHPMRGCDANMADLLNAIEHGIGRTSDVRPISSAEASPPGDFFLIGYSKGTPDALTLLIQRPDLRPRVRCFFNWAGAPGGSYLADDIYNSLKDLPVEAMESQVEKLLALVSPVVKLGPVMQRFHEFDIKGAIRDLTTHVREAFMSEHVEALDAMNLPIFNLTGSTTPLEVPYFQVQGVLELNKYDANNDMQVTQKGAKIKLPMAVDLAMLRGHHWDLSYSPFPKRMRFGSPNLDHPFPKEAAATAMFHLAAELGLID